jgi:F420H(2)-dependent quinone reductase
MPSRGSAPEGHGRFALLNQTGNRIVRGLLRSPLHRLASGRLALITVTGRRSGRRYTIPVAYSQEGERVSIEVGWPERKVWWRNLTGEGGPVRLLVEGRELRGHAVATKEPGRDALVRVRVDHRA